MTDTPEPEFVEKITDEMLARVTEMVRAAYYPKTGPNAYKGIRPMGDRADYDRIRAELLAEWGEETFEDAGNAYEIRSEAAAEAAEAWRTDQY